MDSSAAFQVLASIICFYFMGDLLCRSLYVSSFFMLYQLFS